jgi:phage terminase large subunit
MELTIQQTTALDYLEDKTTKEVLFGGGAGGGKSALIAYWCLKMALKYPGSRGLLGRAILKTLRETTLYTLYDVANMQGVRHTFKPYGQNSLRFKNGSEILLKDLYAYPSDPEFDELGSLELTYAAIDECNQVTQKAKNIVKSRIRYKLDEWGLVPKLGMSCNPAKNWVKSEFHDPWVKGKLPIKKQFVKSLLQDNKFRQSSYEESLQELDIASRERLLMGNWDYSNDPSSLCDRESIEAIFSNTHVLATGKKYITVDVARMGTDKTVIRVWDGWRVIKRIVMEKSRVTAVAAKVKETADLHGVSMFKVLVDEDGVGGGVVDILGCKGFIANSRPIQNDPNNKNYDMLKSQCAWYVAKMINANAVYEQADADVQAVISEELEYLKSKVVDKDAPRSLLSKDNVKKALGRSPDDSDTYIMRAWFDLATVTGPYIITGGVSKVTNGRTI